MNFGWWMFRSANKEKKNISKKKCCKYCAFHKSEEEKIEKKLNELQASE